MPDRSAAQSLRVAQWGATGLIGLVVCLGPLWLWGVPLRWFVIKADDFVYIAWSRTAGALWGHLLAPYHGHVAPLYLILTHGLARGAGTLEALPAVMSGATYVILLVAMAATGHVVAHETGRVAHGLAAMAAVGFTSVLGPCLLWFAASQALAAGGVIVMMLAALQSWRARGGGWRLTAGLLAALAAPLFWSAGFAAGPVGAAYLWADGRPDCRRAAVVLALASPVLAAVIWVVVGQGFAAASLVGPRAVNSVPAVDAVVAHSAQAICEALVLNNLGLDATTTASQAVLFVAALAASWAWSRRRAAGPGERMTIPIRISPLEAAGGVMVVVSFGLIFVARGTDTGFENLRSLGWYDAVAELGAVLFVAGWSLRYAPSPPAVTIEPVSRRELLLLVLFVAVMLTLQGPRAARVTFDYDGSAAPPGPDAPLWTTHRTPADLEAEARAQRRALAALDGLERSVRRGEISRAGVPQAVAPDAVPGMPRPMPGYQPSDLLDLSDGRD